MPCFIWSLNPGHLLGVCGFVLCKVIGPPCSPLPAVSTPTLLTPLGKDILAQEKQFGPAASISLPSEMGRGSLAGL